MLEKAVSNDYIGKKADQPCLVVHGARGGVNRKMRANILYSIITPTRGDRPRALEQAIQSVAAAIEHAGTPASSVEMLVGFDGVDGERVSNAPFVRYFSLPKDGDYGNAVRQALLNAATGRRVLFLDDDNALTPNALTVWESRPEEELLIARIDTRNAFEAPVLPRLEESSGSVIRPGNIDPLCICASRELVVVRCRGWESKGGYEADYMNILKYHRRARSIQLLKDIVGIYDAGLGLDDAPLSTVQALRFARRPSDS